MPYKTAVPPSGETVVAGGTMLVAGRPYVRADTNKVVVPQTAQTATAFLSALGATGNLTTCNVAARTGVYADTGLPIFEAF